MQVKLYVIKYFKRFLYEIKKKSNKKKKKKKKKRKGRKMTLIKAFHLSQILYHIVHCTFLSACCLYEIK